MYYADFRLSGPPFENNLDPRFLYLGRTHKEILAALLYFVKERKDFALICGGVGTGKSMLINAFLRKLPPSVQPINVSKPDVEFREILSYIAQSLGIENTRKRVLELVDDVRKALVETSRLGRRYLLIIDEAHLLPDSSLENIRFLFNMETQEQKLFQILLAGQHELSEKLARPQFRQLRQRININRFLEPMDSSETKRYISHRLAIVGGSYDYCFEPQCAEKIYKMTGGVPRAVNQLCDMALIICKADKVGRVDNKLLKKAQRALRSDLLYGTKRTATERGSALWRMGSRAALVGTYALMLVMLGVMGREGLLGQRIQHFLAGISPNSQPLGVVQIGQEETTSASGHNILLKKMPNEKEGDERGLKSEAPPTEMASNTKSTAEGGVSDNGVRLSVGPKVPAKDATETAMNWGDPQPGPPAETEAGLSGPAAASDKGGEEASGNKAKEAVKPKEAEALASVPARLVIEGGPSKPQSPLPRQVTVKKGDSISKIAREMYPNNPIAAYKAILKANPGLEDGDLVRPGQTLKLPGNGTQRETPPAADLYYAFFRRFAAREELDKAIAWLHSLGARSVVMRAIEPDGKTTYLLLLGGYEQAVDLDFYVELTKTANYNQEHP